ncbi:hypothetical protein ACFYV7_29795 [Nocardia suismassiliense]|uniref:Uncharacterized protein n=1 Tax=Nocardia suismassiliense TaxID=2077092 RepID=A0ABW6R1B4_9NOCA
MSLSKVAITAATTIAVAALTGCSNSGDQERAAVQQILSATAVTTPAATATTTAAVLPAPPESNSALRRTTCEQTLGLITEATPLNNADSTWTPQKFVEGLVSTTQTSPKWKTRSQEDQNAYIDGSRDALTGSCS